MQAGGKSLDDKRTDLLPPEKQGPKPTVKWTKDEHAKNNLPDILSRFALREKSERMNPVSGDRGIMGRGLLNHSLNNGIVSDLITMSFCSMMNSAR